MALWVLGLPLLFWHRWPRLTQVYGVFSISFIVVNRASMWILGECVLTAIARACWQRGTGSASEEWFTVRLARAVFDLTPSHEAVKHTSEALIAIAAIGALVSLRRLRRKDRERTGTLHARSS